MSTENNDNNQTQPNGNEALAALDSKVTNELSALKQGMQQLLQAQQSQAKPQRKQEETSIPDPIVDPKGYGEYLTRQIETRVESKISTQQTRNSQLASLVNSYPELQDQGNELTRKSVEIFSQMSDEEKSSANAYKSAVAMAASELGVLPVSKRKQTNDDDGNFSITNSTSSSSRNRNSNKNKEEDLDPMTVAFAQAIGKDTNDPEYIKRLKQANKRTKWNRYE